MQFPSFEPLTNADKITAALESLTKASEDPLPKLVQLIDAIRPNSSMNQKQANMRWQRMLNLLHQVPRYHDGLRSALLALFAQRRQLQLYTESGLLPNTGFFSELRRKVAHSLLPELIDTSDLRDCIRQIFRHRSDAIWMKSIPMEDQIAFWRLLTPLSRNAFKQITDAARVLSRRICAMGLEPELMRVVPALQDPQQSPFPALNDDLLVFLARLEADEPAVDEIDKRHLLVLVDQCLSAVQAAHRHATATAGTSMSLTFHLTRLEQHLKRLAHMVEILAVKVETLPEEAVVERWSTLMAEICQQELERNSVRKHFSDLTGQITLLVTKNAARTGGHYITEDRNGWRGILKSAAGAGVLIAIMALLKISGHNLHLPMLYQGILNGMIYAGGFVLIYLLHFTIATKQPAMTAATIADTISQSRGRLRDQGKLVELIVATSRSQFAAIIGNISVAFPLAVIIATIGYYTNHASASPLKACRLLQEVQPFSTLSLFYAAIAGVWLFVTGLISGYVDNTAAYSKLGPRLACLGWLQWLVGRKRADKIGDYVSQNAGGLAGNVFFGMMLGLTPTVGQILQLPLDIRHIAFSSANIGYAIISVDDFLPNIGLFTTAVLGVALIGLTNLVVSFLLALAVAMHSRGARLRSVFSLLPLLRQRFKERPRDFFLPAKPEVVDKE